MSEKNFNDVRKKAIDQLIKNNKFDKGICSELIEIYALYNETIKSKYKDIGLKTKDDVLNEHLIKCLCDALSEKHKKMFYKVLELAPVLGNGSIVTYYHRGYRTKNAYNNIIAYIDFLGDLLTYQYMDFDVLKYLSQKDYRSEYCEWTTEGFEKYFTALLSVDEGNDAYECIKKMIYTSLNSIDLSRMMIKVLIQCDREGSNELVLDLLNSRKISEDLCATIIESIDLGTIETYKFFLRYVRKEKLFRFSSVKRSFLCYTGLEDDVSEKTIDYISDYVFECMLDEKTPEYLDSDDAVKFYIGLYSLACHEYLTAIDYIKANLVDISEHKQTVAIEFISKSALSIDAREINYMLENSKNMKLFFCLDSCEINFNTNEEKRTFIRLMSKKLGSLKMKDLKIKSLDGRTNLSVTIYKVYKKLLKLTDEIDDLYELVYPFFDKFFYANYHRDTFNPYKDGIKNDIMKDTLISSLSGKQRVFAFNTINELNPRFTEEDYCKIASLLKSKRSEVRQYINELVLKADENTLLVCAKMLLSDKNIEKQVGGINLLVDTFDKIKENPNFYEIKDILKDLKVPAEIESGKSKILGNFSKTDTKNLFFDKDYTLDLPKLMPFEKNMHTYLESAVTKLTKTTQDALVSKKLSNASLAEVMQMFVDIFEGHAGEDIEYFDYNGEKEGGKVNYSFSTYDATDFLDRIITQSYNHSHKKVLTYAMVPFYIEYMELTKNLKDEELLALWVFTQLYSVAVDSHNEQGFICGVFLSNFIEKSLLINFDISKPIKQDDNSNVDYSVNILKILLVERSKVSNTSFFEHTQNLLLDFLSEFITFEKERIGVKRKFYDALFTKAHDRFKSNNQYTKTILVNQEEINHVARIYYIACNIFYTDIKITEKEKLRTIFYNLCDLQLIGENMPIYIFSELLKRMNAGEIKKDYFYKKVLQENNFSVLENLVAVLDSHNHPKDVKPYSSEIKVLVTDIYEKITNAILETELERTETETVYSKMALKCDFIGAENFIKAVFKMGNTPFERGDYMYSRAIDKKSVFSKIISSTMPEKDLTFEKFTSILSTYDISEKNLLKASMHNIHFMPYIEDYLGIKGLTKGAYFFKAHMNETLSTEDSRIIAKYTTIDVKDLQNGQIDLDWFTESYKELGEENFQKLYDVVKYITDGSKHKRAQYFTDALCGKLSLAEVESHINTMRNQEMILVYGLIPLSKDRLKDALRRYKILQLFLRESKNYGIQKRQSEELKVSIGMTNLAKNYGIQDRSKFLWLMEIELFNSMLSFFEPKQVENITVHISIENIEEPQIIVLKDTKVLKSLPQKYKKIPYIVELKEAVIDLKDQYRRVLDSLENSMMDKDDFTLDELATFQKHPIITTIIKNLLFISNEYIGFLKDTKLIDYTDKSITLTAHDTVKIAHPIHLLQNNSRTHWQNYMQINKVMQRFKQVFRERYTLTSDGVVSNGFTNHFTGYQIDGKPQDGLLQSRTWIISDHGDFKKDHTKEKIKIDLDCSVNWITPTEIKN